MENLSTLILFGQTLNPFRAGGPPIWMGASSKWSYERIAEYCDGWLPIAGQDKDHLQKIKDALQRRGRKKSDITLAMFGVPPDEDFVESKIKGRF